MGVTAQFLVIRIGMYVNWCVIYPTQLTCLSLLMASYITHYANLIGFCSVSNGLLLWLSFFCVLVCLLLHIDVVTTTHHHYSLHFKCTICCKLPSHVKRGDNLCINHHFIDSALRGCIKLYFFLKILWAAPL